MFAGVSLVFKSSQEFTSRLPAFGCAGATSATARATYLKFGPRPPANPGEGRGGCRADLGARQRRHLLDIPRRGGGRSHRTRQKQAKKNLLRAANALPRPALPIPNAICSLRSFLCAIENIPAEDSLSSPTSAESHRVSPEGLMNILRSLKSSHSRSDGNAALGTVFSHFRSAPVISGEGKRIPNFAIFSENSSINLSLPRERVEKAPRFICLDIKHDQEVGRWRRKWECGERSPRPPLRLILRKQHADSATDGEALP
ncbi:hypothetical protein EVAR_99323_1 [Eumeta japonica]|uniref:Uncharacterized protein n=1 Tax=Eumeta variegata TaxID=151549 RepID=A0A4C1ZPZ7_EUMVA|nr:hypothetical protein EVAR_99323_1 [Eumeta japonica]